MLIGLGNMTTPKLKTSQIKEFRERLVREQNWRCALCDQPLTLETAVLDHDHRRGYIRSALHRFCNTFLGKIENSVVRNSITDLQLTHILANYRSYTKSHKLILHPSHRTPEERKELARKRLKLRRKKAKQP